MDSPGNLAAAATSRADSIGDSSDSEGAISVTDSPRPSVNLLLTQSEYVYLPSVKSDRAEWIPGYRDRVRRSSAQVMPWSARRISRISVAELNIHFFHRHFVKPKQYPILTLTVSNHPHVAADWAPGLVSISQIEGLYALELCEMAFPQIAPISFRRVEWFDQLATLYQDYEDRSRQYL